MMLQYPDMEAGHPHLEGFSPDRDVPLQGILPEINLIQRKVYQQNKCHYLKLALPFTAYIFSRSRNFDLITAAFVEVMSLISF